MSLFDEMALRKVATYKIGYFQKRRIEKQIEEISKIISKSNFHLFTLEGAMYSHQVYPEKERAGETVAFRSPLLWCKFNENILRLHYAWNLIHPFPFSEDDIVYPGYLVDDLERASFTIQDKVVQLTLAFNLSGIIARAADIFLYEKEEIPPNYYSHFDITMKYLKRYVKDRTFEPLNIFSPEDLKLVKQLIKYEESHREPFLPIPKESEE